MDLAAKEAKEHGDFELQDGILVTDLAAVMKEILAAAEKEYLIDEDGMLPPYFLEDELMSRLGVSSVTISRMCKAMEEIGDGIMEKKKERKKLLDEQANIIKEYMKEAESGVSRYGKVTWRPQTRESFDRKAFAETYPTVDLSNFCKVSTSRVFKVTAAEK